MISPPATAALCSLLLLPSCQQGKRIGDSLSTGTKYVSRPVISGSKKLADATASGTKKLASATVTGAKSLASGATRLITFGSASKSPPAPAPLAARTPTPEEKGLPPAHAFPTSGLMVSDAELGPDATRLESTAVTLAGGWTLNGSEVVYRLPEGADDPTALRLKGDPATATLITDSSTTTASASELHYHASNQVLTLKGNARLASAGSTVAATASRTLIKIHLPTGAISIDGPARWGE